MDTWGEENQLGGGACEESLPPRPLHQGFTAPVTSWSQPQVTTF